MLIFAAMSLIARAEQIVTGMAMNLCAPGITGTAYAALTEAPRRRATQTLRA